MSKQDHACKKMNNFIVKSAWHSKTLFLPTISFSLIFVCVLSQTRQALFINKPCSFLKRYIKANVTRYVGFKVFGTNTASHAEFRNIREWPRYYTYLTSIYFLGRYGAEKWQWSCYHSNAGLILGFLFKSEVNIRVCVFISVEYGLIISESQQQITTRGVQKCNYQIPMFSRL